MTQIDEHKITIIVYKRDEAEYQRLLSQIRLLQIPAIGGKATTCELVAMSSAYGSRATAYNVAMQQSTARYKVYLDTSILTLAPAILPSLLQAFSSADAAGMVGTWGSSLPLDGDFRHAKHNYGTYAWKDVADGKTHQVLGGAGICYQRVQALDGTCMATCVDVPWDEDVDDAYLATAHACRLQAEHRSTYVLTQLRDGAMVLASRPSPYCLTGLPEWFDRARKHFLSRYGAQIHPLVSILIPAYNQPKFCCEALESALHQTYSNIEILIGDDSTDQRVHKALKPIIKQHGNIQYFYRGNQEGENAARNVHFLLNECHGVYVNLLFHDDMIYPTKIEKMMTHLVEDLDEEIAFITSRRDFVDSDGRSKGEIQGYGGAKDITYAGQQICPQMLQYQTNVIGEMSTVLLRKSLLWQQDAYRTGVFYGYREDSMGDISTWLELLKNGRVCVFLDEKLSAFRDHPAQNTHNPETFLLSYLDWMNLFVLSYLHQTYLRTEADFAACCDSWRNHFHLRQTYLQDKISPAKKKAFDVFQQEIAAIESKNYKNVIQLSIQYMASTGADPARLLAGTSDAMEILEGNIHAGQ